METFDLCDKEVVRSIQCKHLFGKACIYRWLVDFDEDTCPMCRTVLIDQNPQHS